MKQLYRRVALLAIALPLLALCSVAQDIHFSQFFEAPLYRNPALAGLVNGDVRVQTVYRSQWNSVANAYKTTSVNAEYKMPVAGDDYLTLGMQVIHDKAGSVSLTTTQVLPAINYHKSISTERNVYLSLGFMGGYVQRSIDRTKMTTASSYEGIGDGETTLLQPQHNYWDGSTGISLNTQLGENPENNLVLGVAYHHFTSPKSSFYNDQQVTVKPKRVITADARFALGEQMTATFHNDYVTQGANREIISGGLLGYKIGDYSDHPDMVLRGGVFYRWNDALVPVIQLDYRPFSLSMSYDVTTSQLSKSSYGRGGYEMSLTYAGFLDRENSSLDAVRCPRF